MVVPALEGRLSVLVLRAWNFLTGWLLALLLGFLLWRLLGRLILADELLEKGFHFEISSILVSLAALSRLCVV